jgi:hypothetical protein
MTRGQEAALSAFLSYSVCVIRRARVADRCARVVTGHTRTTKRDELARFN